MEDLKKSKKLVLELFILHCFDVFAIQLDFLAQSVAMALYFLVMGFFLQFLCMEKVLIANFYQSSQFLN